MQSQSLSEAASTNISRLTAEMNNDINISQTQIVLAFVATCIEATARTLGVSYREVFMRMKRLGMIENYIFPNYGVLHTESRENIALDMIECMNAWEARL
ncbi:MAG: DUF3791 domain-containing protein [Bacteroidaceae bacterium]|nr:DUF3791 domain-containing protein [Bacteroidaceae bacterium]